MESIIFRTLLHSLWQGVLLAVLTALTVLFTTKSNARIRYNLFVGCLILFVAGVGTTFFLQMNQWSSPASTKITFPGATGLNITLQPAKEALLSPKIVDNLIGYLGQYSSSIVLIWFLIICAKSVRFMVDIRTLVLVRTTKVYHAGTLLEEKVNQLALQYGIKQTVRILQSGIIKVPMVLGHFKPLILVPLGLINGLSIQEVDAILSHELAHIKRRDYLVNLLQSTVEILFFFNPAVLWVSNMIKTERENCCDDLAVSTTKTKIDYIKALVSCQEFASEVPAYAMAVNGGKNNLVNRVQRLISSKNQSLNKLEKVIIGVILVSSIAITSAFSGKEAKPLPVPQKEKKQSRIQSAKATAVAYPEERTTATAQMQGDDNSEAIYAQLLREGLIKAGNELYCTLDKNAFIINGKRQSAAIHKKYASTYLKPGQTLSYRFKGNEEHKDVEVSINDSPKINEATKKRIQAEISAARAAEVSAQQVEVRALANAKAAQANARQVEARASANAVRAQANAQQVEARASANADRAQANAQQVEARAIANADRTQQQAINAQKKAIEAQTKAAEKAKNGNSMFNELIADGLVKDKKNFSYQLNVDELIVDEVKQPDAIHRKYMRKYLKTAKQKISARISTN